MGQMLIIVKKRNQKSKVEDKWQTHSISSHEMNIEMIKVILEMRTGLG